MHTFNTKNRQLSFLSSEMQKLLHLIAAFLVLLPVKSVISAQKSSIPAVIVFGDSIVDAGNNNELPGSPKCNFPPYGRDFYAQKATGRFSNGKIINDIIVSEVGLKEYLPAYLDPNLQDEDLLTGVTFGSGAAGLDDLTSRLAMALSTSAQLELFKEYKKKLVAFAGQERADYIITHAQYLVANGNNDMWGTYLFSGLRKAQYDLPNYADFLVSAASEFVKELYALGARKIVFLGLPPLGCVPAVRTLAGGLGRDCAENYNQASLLYNGKLQPEIVALNRALDGSVITYLDIYHPLLDIMQNPAKYGFEESTRGCCGTGEVEGTYLCNQMTPFTCQDASKFVFWDSFHPTEKANRILVNEFIHQFI